MGLDSGWAGHPAMRFRFILFSLAAIGIFLLLILRLWFLQVVSSDRYLTLSEKNRIRYIPIAAPRGAVYDREGNLLVSTRPAFTISVLRQEVEDREALLTRLATYLGSPREDLRKRWQAGVRFPRYRPLPLAEDVSRDILERVQENSYDLPGVLAEVQPLRSYLNGELAAHLLGYLGEITEDDLRQMADEEGYRPGDFIGKSGLEKRLEKYLRGTSGERRVEVDVRGKELRPLLTRDPLPGNRVFLTLKRDLQLAAEAAFGDQAGAAVVIDVRNGEVLAMVSRPAFDPAAFASGISGEDWIRLLKDPRHPLQNKAIKGQYPPGSTYKIVTALAALQNRVARPNTTVYCSGSFSFGNREFRCWKKEGHGTVDLKKALRESCDVWFYQMGLELGPDRIAETARALGLGSPLGLPLDGEKGGLVPSQKWKQGRFNEKWYDGESLITAIGQGYVLATPLQLAMMTATVANGGTLYRPQVVRRVEDLQGKVLFEEEPEVLHRLEIAPEYLRAVQRGMVAVVNEAHGTGRASQIPDPRFTVAGKTGTSQVIRQKERIKDGKTIPYKFRDHALFVAYAPADDPQIAVGIVVEHGVGGGSAAAPIARAIFENYFGLETKPPEPAPVAAAPPVPATPASRTPASVMDAEPTVGLPVPVEPEPVPEILPEAAPADAPKDEPGRQPAGIEYQPPGE